MLHKTTQLSVMAVAALAIVAVVAVALFAAGGARAENVTTNALPYESGNGPPPQQETTTHPTPEPCADPPADVVSRGEYALFDVYWQPVDETGAIAPEDENTLVTNPCPPSVEHIVKRGKVVRTDRSASDINIESTIIHIPHAYRRTVVGAATTPENPLETDGVITVATNSILYGEYEAEATERHAWVLAEWGPETSEEEELLHMGFSAGLLKESDWNGDIEYEFESFREPGVDDNDRGAVLTYSERSFDDDDIIWDTSDADRNEFHVTPGEYDHVSWVFTRPGTYIYEVHAKGHPLQADSPLTDAETVTSQVRKYTFHVGLLADLNLDIEPDSPTVAPGNPVSLTLTANNQGPNSAPDTKVTLPIPDGLTLTSDSDKFSVSDGEGVWDIGTLANDGRETLAVTATVAATTPHGEKLNLTGTIGATETIGSSKVDELDPNLEDNTVAVIIMVSDEPNVNPMFGARRSVEVDADAGDKVGPPILVIDPDGPTPTYKVSDQDNFDVSPDSEYPGAQIIVKENASLALGTYKLTLTVSDGKDPSSNMDDVTDDEITVLIDVVPPPMTVTLRTSATNQVQGNTIELTATTSDASQDAQLKYSFAAVDLEDGHIAASHVVASTDKTSSTWSHTYPFTGLLSYTVTVSYVDGSGEPATSSERVHVNWTFTHGNGGGGIP